MSKFSFRGRGLSEAYNNKPGWDVLQRVALGAMDDPAHIRHFLRFQGLGLAILRAMPRERLEQLGLMDKVWAGHPQGEPLPPRQPSVVVDEIDKAPGDFCNDMLEEIRKLQFSVPELSERPFSIYSDPDNPESFEENFRPQLVITSNSETGLPDPFLRRCVYYHMEGPTDAGLERILERRLDADGLLSERLDPEIRQRSREFFLYLREGPGREEAFHRRIAELVHGNGGTRRGVTG